VGIGASIISVSGSEIIARTNGILLDSCGNESGETRVVNIETGDGAQGTDFIYRVFSPVVGDVSPTSFPEGGGPITLSGANLESPVQVVIGGRRANNVVVQGGGTQITATVPAFTGTFPTEDCTVGNVSGTQLGPVAVDLQVINLLTTCEDTLPTQIVYTPANGGCIPDPPVASFTSSVSGTTASFQNTSSNAASSSWNFGDGGSSTATNPSHSYTVPPSMTESFTVTLTVNNGAGQTDSASSSVEVTAPGP